MKTAAKCESQCKMHYLLNRSSTRRTHMAAHHVGHACPRVGYTSARARTVLRNVVARRCLGGGQTRHLAGLPPSLEGGDTRAHRPPPRGADGVPSESRLRAVASSGPLTVRAGPTRSPTGSTAPHGTAKSRPRPSPPLTDRTRSSQEAASVVTSGEGPSAGRADRRRRVRARARAPETTGRTRLGAAPGTPRKRGSADGAPRRSHLPTSDQARLPARFKHISKRRKRN